MNCKENPAPAPNADGLAARLNHAADDYSKMLEKPSFRPSRDMLEDCRNLLRQASAAIANPAPQTNVVGYDDVYRTLNEWSKERRIHDDVAPIASKINNLMNASKGT